MDHKLLTDRATGTFTVLRPAFDSRVAKAEPFNGSPSAYSVSARQADSQPCDNYTQLRLNTNLITAPFAGSFSFIYKRFIAVLRA
jgi:hypothetical protein